MPIKCPYCGREDPGGDPKPGEGVFCHGCSQVFCPYPVHGGSAKQQDRSSAGRQTEGPCRMCPVCGSARVDSRREQVVSPFLAFLVAGFGSIFWPSALKYACRSCGQEWMILSSGANRRLAVYVLSSLVFGILVLLCCLVFWRTR